MRRQADSAEIAQLLHRLLPSLQDKAAVNVVLEQPVLSPLLPFPTQQPVRGSYMPIYLSVSSCPRVHRSFALRAEMRKP